MFKKVLIANRGEIAVRIIKKERILERGNPPLAAVSQTKCNKRLIAAEMAAILADSLVVGVIDVVPKQIIVAVVAAPPDTQDVFAEVSLLRHPEVKRHFINVVVTIVVLVIKHRVYYAVRVPVGYVKVTIQIGPHSYVR